MTIWSLLTSQDFAFWFVVYLKWRLMISESNWYIRNECSIYKKIITLTKHLRILILTTNIRTSSLRSQIFNVLDLITAVKLGRWFPKMVTTTSFNREGPPKVLQMYLKSEMDIHAPSKSFVYVQKQNLSPLLKAEASFRRKSPFWKLFLHISKIIIPILVSDFLRSETFPRNWFKSRRSFRNFFIGYIYH